MKLRMPSYCKAFKCSAEKCSDNCCIGWEIDIDSEACDFYKDVSGDFGERLKRNISVGECASFVLDGERCPFLNENNLCDIIINLGEDKLCQICRDHPRYFEWYGSLKEGGVGLCCEEAARLILESENPTDFTEEKTGEKEAEEIDEELFECLYRAREVIFRIILEPEKSLKQRVSEMLDFSEKLQINIDNYIYELPEASFLKEEKGEKDLLSVFLSLKKTEPIDEGWEAYLERLIRDYSDRAFGEDLILYQRNLLIYFIYRYFLKGVFDGEILSKVKLSAVSVSVITYIIEKQKDEKGDVSLADIIDICKLWSKQIEYSQDNLDLLSDLFYSEDFYKSERIINYF